MKCVWEGKAHHHVDVHVRQGSVRGNTLPKGAEVWVRTEEVPVKEKWNYLRVYNYLSGRILAETPVGDRSKNRIKVLTTHAAPVAAIRAIIVHESGGRDEDPSTLGDGNGAVRVQP